ncbi:MAG: amino acid carrier protein [Ruminococcus sp.]|nr:amino acid carrier protein [Ruminococcus sp.]MCM1381115.1 amino acid carrier protein [Muribaculaceae bacterium]MCM1479967.1 amino acid carrier protein [Muribaculaceae bacterium]
MYDTICNILSKLNDLLWGFGTVLLVFGAGVFFTVKIKGFNFIHIVYIFKSTLFRKSPKEKGKKGNISQFQALSTALAASMGTGNIVGVAAAISIGGAGAVFWMWVSALFGTALAFAENVLGVRYKNVGGRSPMAYISKALGSPAMGTLYAAVCAAASFGIGNMTQTNSIASAAGEVGISPIAAGAVTAIACGAVIFRGARRVAEAAEKIIPAVSVLYFLTALSVIVIFGKNLLPSLKCIITSAIGLNQVLGGLCGAAVKKAASQGLRRGVFSNEAGMGSSVLVHTETDCAEPVQMGMWAVAEVVLDTVVCCTLTALVILVTGAESSGKTGLAMAAEGFRRGLGDGAAVFTAAAAMIFAFCTLLGWYFYGEKCLTYITKNKGVLFAFRGLYTAAAFVGAVSRLEPVWAAADVMNWIMLAINLTAVLVLSGETAAETARYLRGMKRK